MMSSPAGRLAALSRQFAPSAAGAAATPPPLGVAGAAHLARASSDVPALATFYVDVLGFHRLERPEFPFDGAWLRSGDFMIHIIEAPPTGNKTFESDLSLDERHGAAPTKRTYTGNPPLLVSPLGYFLTDCMWLQEISPSRLPAARTWRCIDSGQLVRLS